MTTDVDCIFSDAYAFFDQGLCYDEVNDTAQAKSLYIKGLALVEKGEKMKKAKKSALYDDIMAMKKRVQDRLREMDSNTTLDSKNAETLRTSLLKLEEKNTSSDAELIYWLPENVQIVSINDDVTSAPELPTSLAILKLLEHQNISKDAEHKVVPKALIQVGPWAYPLLGPQTMILKNEMGIYVVPNPTPERPNMCMGIILPRDIDPQLERDFIDVLKMFATVEASEIVSQMGRDEREHTSERISQFFIKSGQALAGHVQRAAEITGDYVQEYGNRYRSSIPERTDPAVNVNPALRHGVYYLYRGSKGVAKVTKYLLDKVGDIGVSVGRQVANSMTSGNGSGSRLIKSTTTVAAGGITGASTVWIALENASKTLFRSFADETVQTARIKYGDDVAQTTHHGLHAIGHTTLASYQLYDLGPRSIAGRMARKAGIQIVTGGRGGPSRTTVQPLPEDSSARQALLDSRRDEKSTKMYPTLTA